MVIKELPVAYTLEEYFALDAIEPERRYEYIDGEIREVPGGTDNHSRIKVNTTSYLHYQLRGSDCLVYNSDMCVRISPTRYVFPDLSAVCGEPQLDTDRTTLRNPIMAVEVTSPSSRHIDHVQKLAFYRSLPSMRLYLIVEQERAEASLHLHTDEGWIKRVYPDLDDVIPLDALGCNLPLAEIYREIDFAP